MKKNLTFLLPLVLFSFQTLWADQHQFSCLQEQLEDLNYCWKAKKNVAPVLIAGPSINEEVRLIQTHLSLVEKNLRAKNTDHLSESQRAKRINCFDILEEYWKQGVFPQNLYHKQRTPYFIDHLGTACAVGHLLVETGFEDFAKKVAATNNYVYIKDLEKENAGLKRWADQYGFAIEELAWIQPTYAICDSTCNQSLYASPLEGIAPYTYLWSNGSTSAEATDLCPGSSYACLIVDAQGDTINNMEMSFQASIGNENPFTIPAAELPVTVDITATTDCACDGTATAVSTSSGVDFFYYWQDGSIQGATITGLCSGDYTVTVYNSIGCTGEGLITVLPEIGIEFSTTEDNGSCNGALTVNLEGGLAPFTYSWDAVNQNSEFLTDLCEGDYSVTVTDANGCQNSKTVNVPMLTKIGELATAEMHLYPNPTKSEITIQLNELYGDKILTIHNMRGQLLLEKPVSGEQVEMNLADYENGLYFISVSNGEKSIRRKIVKTN